MTRRPERKEALLHVLVLWEDVREMVCGTVTAFTVAARIYFLWKILHKTHKESSFLCLSVGGKLFSFSL